VFKLRLNQAQVGTLRSWIRRQTYRADPAQTLEPGATHAPRGYLAEKGLSMKDRKIYFPVPVTAAREIAEKYSKNMVIVNAWDPVHEVLHTTTYGVTAVDKAMAADGGKIAAKALDADLLQMHQFEDYRLTEAKKLLGVLKAMATFHGAVHEESADGVTPDCPGDDTCDCRFKPFNDLINRTINEADEKLGDTPEAEWRP
jgi:hypothetical protein